MVSKFKEANQLLRSGKLEEAVATYRAAIEENAGFYGTYQNLGETLWKLGRLDEAIAAFRKVLELNPRSVWGLYQLGELLRQQKQFEEAVIYLRRAVEIKSDVGEFYLSLGAALVELGSRDEAVGYLRQAIKLNSLLAEAYYYLGVAQSQQKDWSEAVKYYRQGLEINPGDVDGYLGLAKALSQLGKWSEAVESYRQVLRLSESGEVMFRLGQALGQLEQWEEAIAECQQAINLGFAGAEVRHHLGYALSKLGRYEEAVVELRQVVEENPRSAPVRHQLGYALSQLKRWREAEIELRKSAELKPEAASIWQHLENVLQKLGKTDQIADQFYPDLKDKKIVVYTCNFGNYESVKEPLTIDPRVEYILFTDNKDLQSEKWKVVQISKFADSPRRTSRLAKILSHQYLPEHDFSVYIDSSFTLIESDIYRMVQQCMEGSEIALYRHSERNCVYDEIDFCEKSEIRNVDSETCSKVRSKYKSINYPSNNGLFENGFIFRKNTSRVQRLNELWWSEYLEGSERDQFTLMYCLYSLNIKPHTIRIGRQMRKNPFVKWKKHKYKSYENYIDNSQFYIVYIEKFHNWGTTRLRGQQIYQRLQNNLNIRMIPYSQAVHLHNKHMLFLKIHNYDVLLPVIQNNNKIYLDMVDCNSKYINPKKNIFKEVEFGIFTTKSSLDYYKNLFKYPEQCRTIYHHWDITLDKFKPGSLNMIRIGYFGVKPKGFLYGEIPGIDFHEVTSTNFDDTFKSKMSSYNVQYIVRPIEEQKEFPALTKLSTASVFHAPVISSKTNEVELLGYDYPYYIDRLDRESVLKTIEKVKATFQKDEWNYAVDIMKSIKEKTSIDLIIKEYLYFFSSLSKIPSFYTNIGSQKKVIYTANIGGYDKPIPLNPELSQGWDAYYFSDDPNFECSGWKHIYVDTKKITRHSKVAYAREIKARPHLYFPDYDVTLWIDSNLSVERKLNDYLKNLPDDDFITTEHPKRRCIYEELQQPRVVVKIGKSIRDQIKQDLEGQGFPRKFGLQETRFILRKNTEKCRLIGEAWWSCMEKYHAYRDQLWLSYILFKTGLSINCISRDLRDRYFDIAEHLNLVATTKRYALDFSSHNRAYIEIPDQNNLTLTGDLTIEFWIKIKEWPDTWTCIISKQLNDWENEFCFRIKNAKVGQFYYSSREGIVVLDWTPKSHMKLDLWTHIVCVRKICKFQRIYVNGALIQEAVCATKGEAVKTEAPILLMTDARHNQFANAQMCDLRIWHRALEDYEIMNRMNQELQGNEDSLIGYWKFDSGQGTQLIDNSCGYKGLIYGATWEKLNPKLSENNLNKQVAEVDINHVNQRDRRRNFIEKYVENLQKKTILEIGSLNYPTFVKSDHEIYFADYLSQKDLKKKYPHKSKKIHEVDFILKVDAPYYECISQKFDLVIANHVIEHIPDIISWLEDIALITNERGMLFLAVPDKRYTFDILRTETTLGDLLEANFFKYKVPTYRSIFSHQYESRNITCKEIWSGKDVSQALSQKKLKLTDAARKTRKMVGDFHSLHCHVFTKNSFVSIFEELQQAGFIQWRMIQAQDVQFGGNEFLIILQK